jgi:hypothetical protein
MPKRTDSSKNTPLRTTSENLLKVRESILPDSRRLTQSEIDSLRKESREFHRKYKGYFSHLK